MIQAVGARHGTRILGRLLMMHNWKSIKDRPYLVHLLCWTNLQHKKRRGRVRNVRVSRAALGGSISGRCTACTTNKFTKRPANFLCRITSTIVLPLSKNMKGEADWYSVNGENKKG